MIILTYIVQSIRFKHNQRCMYTATKPYLVRSSRLKQPDQQENIFSNHTNINVSPSLLYFNILIHNSLIHMLTRPGERYSSELLYSKTLYALYCILPTLKKTKIESYYSIICALLPSLHHLTILLCIQLIIEQANHYHYI